MLRAKWMRFELGALADVNAIFIKLYLHKWMRFEFGAPDDVEKVIAATNSRGARWARTCMFVVVVGPGS